MPSKMRSVIGAIAMLLGGSVVLAITEPLPRPVTPPAVVPGQKPPGKLVPPPGGPEAAQAAPAQARIEGNNPIIAGDDAAVAPFLDDNTFFVARVDASAMDLKSQQDWLLSAMDLASKDKAEIAEAKKDLPKALDEESAWVARFRKAGGKRLYMAMSLSDLPKYGPFVVVPLNKGEDAAGLIALFSRAGAQSQPAGARSEGAARVGDAVVFGELAIIDRLRTMPAAKPRPELSLAMAAAGNAPVRMVLIPSDSLRIRLEELLPTMPDELAAARPRSFRAASHGSR
ncbi:MAG TPA: hypothetical protein VFC78_20685 [Tepidisphaeraceae bacterium]|nr:hypothetical protein [Tepidisphaeraceae bacterium]